MMKIFHGLLPSNISWEAFSNEITVKSQKTPEVKTGEADESARGGSTGSGNPAFGRGPGATHLIPSLPACLWDISQSRVKEALPLAESQEHWLNKGRVLHDGTSPAFAMRM